MGKHLTELAVLGLCFVLISASVNLFVSHSSQLQSGGNGYVAVYVNSTIYSSIKSSVDQYKLDVEGEGFTVSVFNWSDTSVVNLKSNLTGEYTARNLTGAVLIGEMPFAFYEDTGASSIYPSDLFLMDLDGVWGDLNGVTGYEVHSNGTGDMYPEIFIGRINPYCQSVVDASAALNNYFARDHMFHSGTLTRSNNSLMFIDEDWQSTSEEWRGDLLYLYSDITMVNTTGNTNPGDYLNCLNGSYEFIHAFIHSDQHTHYFKPNYTQPSQQLNYTQIAGCSPNALFYNLYCCYASDFNTTNNFATCYLFASNYTLAVFGTTRAGGFLMNKYLYEPLSEGKTLGEAFHNWWFNDVLDPEVHTHGPSDKTVTGNILLGDPFIRIREVQSTPSGQQPLDLTIVIGAVAAVAVVAAISFIILKKRR